MHTFFLEPFRDRGVAMVRFRVHPLQRRSDLVNDCVAQVVEQRWVTDSGGHKEKRYVIATTIELGRFSWNAELTLTNRDSMLFRMLLGRTALAGRFAVDPGASFLIGRKRRPR